MLELDYCLYVLFGFKGVIIFNVVMSITKPSFITSSIEYWKTREY